MIRKLLLPILILTSLAQSACNGNDCAALTSPLVDGDSDCIADSSDNCPGIPNFDQVDLDEDEVGAACDVNDANEDVASISAPPTVTADFLVGTYLLQNGTCDQADESLVLTQVGDELLATGDRMGEYDTSLTIDDEGISHLNLLQDSQSCEAVIADSTNLSFYCHDIDDSHSNGCANVFEKF